MRKTFRAVGTVLAFTALPVNAAGLQPGRTNDTREDIVRAASQAEEVAELARFEHRAVVILPPEPVVITMDDVVMSSIVPQPADIVVTGRPDDRLLGLFILGGLAGLPLLMGGGAAGGVPTPSGGRPGGPAEVPPPPPVPPLPGPPPPIAPAVPEPTTWAMLLLGFAAIGSTIRRTRTTRRPLTASSVAGRLAAG